MRVRDFEDSLQSKGEMSQVRMKRDPGLEPHCTHVSTNISPVVY
jgi:hypothetical protein